MLTLSELSASPLFWEIFWPSLSFGAAAVAFLAPLVWLRNSRDRSTSRGSKGW